MKNITKKHFVFDLDETLVDSREFCSETIARVLKHFNSDIDEEKVVALHDKFGGSTIVDHYERMRRDFNIDVPIKRLLDKDADIQKKEVYRMQLFDGVTDILKFLKDRYKTLHILTNRKKDTLLPILKHTDIGKYFDNIISCVDEGYKKPNPQCMNDLVTELKTNKEKIIYFGDTKIDREFAKNAEVDFVVFDQYLNDKEIFKKIINLFVKENQEADSIPPKAIINRIRTGLARIFKPRQDDLLFSQK